MLLEALEHRDDHLVFDNEAIFSLRPELPNAHIPVVATGNEVAKETKEKQIVRYTNGLAEILSCALVINTLLVATHKLHSSRKMNHQGFVNGLN